MSEGSDRQPPGGGRTLVICPSRGRPRNIIELVDCWAATGATAQLVVCVDDDDPELSGYHRAVEQRAVELVVGERRGLCGWTNEVASALCERWDIIGMIGDDVRPRTAGWDVRIVEAMKPLGVVYGDDLHQRETLCTHPFLDSEIVRRLGWMAPPELTHLYLDNFWMALGQHLGTLTYLPDVVLEHMHPHAGKADMDAGYQAVNNRAAYRESHRAFTTYMAERFAVDMEKLS